MCQFVSNDLERLQFGIVQKSHMRVPTVHMDSTSSGMRALSIKKRDVLVIIIRLGENHDRLFTMVGTPGNRAEEVANLSNRSFREIAHPFGGFARETIYQNNVFGDVRPVFASQLSCHNRAPLLDDFIPGARAFFQIDPGGYRVSDDFPFGARKAL